MASPEGMAYTALAGLASVVLKDWYHERKAREAIIKIFQQRFVVNGRIQTTQPEFTIADLTFTIDPTERSSIRIGKGYQVQVVNNRLSGDNPRHLRSFRYWDRPHKVLGIETGFIGMVSTTWAPTYYQVHYFRK